jgi:4-amino-4-deoxy-L-arabinose transferase-like glycosyltransferase
MLSLRLPTGADWRRRSPLICVLGATALLGSVSLIYPFARDHGIYAYIAEQAMHGKLLYRDILMGMLPLTVMVHEVALTLFGRSMTAIRVLDLFWTMATALLVFAFVQRAFRRPWLAAAAGMMYSFQYYLFDFWNTAQNDGFLNLPVAAAFFLVAVAQNPEPEDISHRSEYMWLLAGIMLGLALLFKQTIGLVVPGLAVFALAGQSSARTRNWRSFLLFTAGVVVCLGIALLIMAGSGALPGFLEGQARIALPYSRLKTDGGGLLAGAADMLVKFITQPDLGVCGGLGFIGLVLVMGQGSGDRGQGTGNRERWMVVVWLVSALASTYVQGKFFFYHYLPLLPPLAILGAFALATVYDWLAVKLVRDRQRVVLFLAIAAGLLISTGYPERYMDLARVGVGDFTVEQYWFANIHSTPEFSLAEQMTVAEHLAENTPEDARVYLWGVDPLVNFLARRPTVSRFIYNHPLAATWAWPGYRSDLMRTLTTDPPEVFVTEHRDATPWVMGHDLDSYQSLMDFPKLRDFVSGNYELETRIGRFDILRRAGADSAYPRVEYPSSQLIDDLTEAARYVDEQDSEAYRTVLWPGSLRTVPRTGIAAAKLTSYQELVRRIWLEKLTLLDALPAVSIWIRSDPRPFAALDPFRFQSDGEHYISEDLRFTLLHECRNRRVLVYQVSKRSGSEPLKRGWRMGNRR